MHFDVLIDTIPSYAKDLKLNFSSVVRQQTDLNEQQAWGTVVASAIASRNQQLILAALEEGATHLGPEALEAAKAAAAIRSSFSPSSKTNKSQPARAHGRAPRSLQAAIAASANG